MALAERRPERVQSAKNLKRELILDAARQVFETEGLDGASIRAIAGKAGYTPAALYFHFESKEAIYAEVLHAAIRTSIERVNKDVSRATSDAERLRAAAMAFFNHYAENPKDLDLGFYLFRGGMRPMGLGRARDQMLNAALTASLQPIADAARKLGASQEAANLIMVDTFAHASGLLLLAHTGRMRLFHASAPDLMTQYVDDCIERLERKR